MWSMSKREMRHYTTFMLCITVFFLFADQNLLAPNLSAVADDFNMSESERDEKLGGYIAFGFFVVGGPIALLVGYFADTANRPMLFGLVVAFGESACFATYWVRNYGELFACRVLTGVSIGGATPIIFSMLGDLYPGESRIHVSTLVGVALSAGIAGGQLLAGLVGPALGWRAPFLFVAVPALICAILVFMTVVDPPRGDQEEETRRLRLLEQSSQHIHQVSEHGLSSPAGHVIPVKGSAMKNPLRAVPSSLPQGYFVLEQNDGDHNTPTPPGHIHREVKYDINKDNDQSGELMDTDTFIETSNVRRVSSIGSGSGRYSPDNATQLSQHGESTFNPTIMLSQQEEEKHRQHKLQESSDKSSNDNDVSLEYAERIDCNKVLKLFSTPSVAIVFIQGFPGCLPWGMIYVFLNDYFSEDRGLSIEAATAALTCFGVGGLAGQFVGGWIGQWLYNRDPRYQCVLMGSTTILSVFPMLYLLNTPDAGSWGFYFVSLLAGFLVSMNGPNVRVVLQNVCIPEIRGTAFAVFSLTDDIGKGLGPALVVLFIKACNGNRREAFNIVVLFWLFCGVLLLFLTQTVVKDEASVQASVRDALAAAALDPQNMAETTENPLGIRLLDAQAPPVSTEETSTGNKSARRSMPGGYESI